MVFEKAGVPSDFMKTPKECDKSECSNYSMVIITQYYSMVLYDNCSVVWELQCGKYGFRNG